MNDSHLDIMLGLFYGLNLMILKLTMLVTPVLLQILNIPAHESPGIMCNALHYCTVCITVIDACL